MMVDTEWEDFGNGGQLSSIETDVDRAVDAASVHVGKQTQDKYVAGLYMGELVRRLLIEYTSQHECDGLTSALEQKDCFPAQLVSDVLKYVLAHFSC